MFLVDRVVNARSYKIAVLWLLRDVVVAKKERIAKGNHVGAYLGIALIVSKEEELVLLDRSADSCSVLSSNKERIQRGLATRGIGIEA